MCKFNMRRAKPSSREPCLVDDTVHSRVERFVGSVVIL